MTDYGKKQEGSASKTSGAHEGRAPGPGGLPRLGSALDLQRDSLGFLERGSEYGDVWSFFLPRGLSGTMLVHMVSRPEHAEHVLRDNADNYRKSAAYRRLGRVVGEGLLTSEGEAWRRQRRLAQPAYHRRRLEILADTITASTSRMVDERWRPAAEQHQTVDVMDEMQRLSLEIIGRAMLSVDLSEEASSIGWAVREFLGYADRHIRRVWSPPEGVPTPANRRFLRALRSLDNFVYGIIEERRRDSADHGDLLSMLLAAYDEDTGEGLSDKQVRDEVMTTLIAGHETTAAALTWSLVLLQRNPESEAQLWREVSEVLEDRPASFEDVGRDGELGYTQRVFEESLRLYPPIWMIPRIAEADDEIGGYHIPQGSRVIVSPYLVHRNAEVWPDPGEFDPERFLPNRTQERHRFAHVPFGGGPRGCIGSNLARMEGPLVLATIAQKCRLESSGSSRVSPKPGVALRPGQTVAMSPRFGSSSVNESG